MSFFNLTNKLNITQQRVVGMKAVANNHRTKMQLIVKENNIGKPKTDPKDIKIVCTDVDGTLITPDVKVTPRIAKAIQAVKDKGIVVVICTGKAKGPWCEEVQRVLGSMKGVYINGTSIEEEDESIVYEVNLSHEVLKLVFDFSNERNMPIVPFSRRKTYATEDNIFTDIISKHLKEPVPEIVGSLYDLIGNVPVQKCCFTCTKEQCDMEWDELERIVDGKAALTSAVDGIIEVLPHGCNKGTGVKVFLDREGFNYKEALAIGDGANDYEMLSQAGIAVAMGHGKDKIKGVADYITLDNTQDGWAIAMEEILLKNI